MPRNNMKKNNTPYAKGQCQICNELIVSLYEGHCVFCKCGKSMVDTCRGMPNIHRYGGAVKGLSNRMFNVLQKGRNKMPVKKVTPTKTVSKNVKPAMKEEKPRAFIMKKSAKSTKK